MTRPTVLVPIQVLEGESIPEGVPELLARGHVLLLGYHELPEQTATEQASEQFGPRANDRLDEFAKMFREAGALVTTRLVFTHQRQQTINRMILEQDCAAVLVPAAAETVQRVLVAVRDSTTLDRMVAVLGGLFAETDVELTLFHAAGAEETDTEVKATFAAFREGLTGAGIDPDRIETRTGEGRPLPTIESAAPEYDVVVMGETDPSVATYVFGLPEAQLAEQFLGPVLVVQRPPPED